MSQEIIITTIILGVISSALFDIFKNILKIFFKKLLLLFEYHPMIAYYCFATIRFFIMLFISFYINATRWEQPILHIISYIILGILLGTLSYIITTNVLSPFLKKKYYQSIKKFR